MKLGFHGRERMTGLYHLLEAPLEDREMAISFVARAGVRGFLREPRFRVEGTIDMEGFATGRAVEGTVLLEPPDWRLRYDFTFLADDGQPYLLRGEKDVQIIALVDSLTTLAASLYPGTPVESAGAPVGRPPEIARAFIRFDVRGDLIRFLRSWRLEASLW